jgi:hypothetical protein
MPMRRCPPENAGENPPSVGPQADPLKDRGDAIRILARTMHRQRLATISPADMRGLSDE